VQQGDVGRSLTVIQLASGEIGVAYRDHTNGALNQIRRVSGVWGSPIVVDPGPNRGQHFDIAYRSGDGYLFTEYDPSNGAELLLDPTLQARSWAVASAVASANDVGRDLDLLKETDGSLLATYRNQTLGALQYARFSGGAWASPVTVDPGPNRGKYFDVAERTGLGYAFTEYDQSNGAVLFLDPALQARSWSVASAVASANDVGRDLNLLRETGGGLVATYRNQTLGALQYARFSGGSWASPVTVDPGPNRGQYFDIVERTGLGYAFSEYDPSQGAVLLFDPVLQARSFAISQVTSGDDDVGPGLALLAEPGGGLAASYRNVTQGSLQHIRRVQGAWTAPVAVDAGPNRGQNSDLTRMPDGRYCFTEYEPGQGSVLLAHPDLRARSFTMFDIDGMKNDGRQLSLLRNDDGRLDCAYVSEEPGGRLKLKVAEMVTGYAFVVKTVADSVALVANAHVQPDVAVTPANGWYVSYRKHGVGDLYVATTDNFQLLPADVPDAPDTPDDESASTIARSVLEGSYPNPAPGGFRVRFTAASESEGELILYNAQGRTVRRLELRCRKGENTIPFDGLDEEGSGLASGIYFLRLAVGQQDLGTMKVVLTGLDRR
jgi:hypothetical protein